MTISTIRNFSILQDQISNRLKNRVCSLHNKFSKFWIYNKVLANKLLGSSVINIILSIIITNYHWNSMGKTYQRSIGKMLTKETFTISISLKLVLWEAIQEHLICQIRAYLGLNNQFRWSHSIFLVIRFQYLEVEEMEPIPIQFQTFRIR